MRLSGLPARRLLLTRSPAKRSASRGETTPIHHSGTFPAGGALRLSGHRPADSGGLVARSAQRHRE